ncbi:MAG: DNA helicase UvrBC [Planctomyces sp.]|jgi:protein arginine kinase activator|nr:DNA helicase UvrBC [Planctomyces sp.]
MKKCEQCSKPAVLHITELHDGAVDAHHLCESCAKDYLSHGSEPEVDEVESGLSQEDDLESDSSESIPEEQPPCPNCGITFKEFRSLGRLGCAHDYSHFREELSRLIENIHSEVQHVGKVPKRQPDASRQQFDLIRLKLRLKEAVDEEQYEEAASIRDQIRRVEADLRSPSATADS